MIKKSAPITIALKKIVKIFSIISVVISLIWIVISCCVEKLPEKETFVYEGGKIVFHSWHDIYGAVSIVLLCIFLTLSILLIIICIKNKMKIRWLMLICCVCIVFTILNYCGKLIVVGAWSEEDYYPEYYEFTNDGRTIVIEESSFLLLGEGTIYQVEDNGLASIIGSFGTDDGGRNNGDYEIKWADDYVEITYNTFNSVGNEDDIRTIRVNLK